MAIGSTVSAKSNKQPTSYIVPVSLSSDWVQIHDDVTAFDGASNGTAITNPGTNTQAAVHPFDTNGVGTILQLAVRYTATRTLSTDPTFNVFGFDGSGTTPFAGVPTAIKLADGTYIWTIADDSTNDPTFGLLKQTQITSIDLLGLRFAGVFVKTAGILSGAGAATLWARMV